MDYSIICFTLLHHVFFYSAEELDAMVNQLEAVRQVPFESLYTFAKSITHFAKSTKHTTYQYNVVLPDWIISRFLVSLHT